MTSGTLIVGAAPAPGALSWYRAAIAGAPVVIAADGGLELCRAAGRVPEICIGDFDSVDEASLAAAAAAGARVVRFPAEKDASDLDLAIGLCRQEGLGPVLVTAAFTGRPDHTLAAFGALVRGRDLKARAEEPDWWASALMAGDAADLALRSGTRFSLLAIEGTAVVSVSGARYPLRDRPLRPLSSHGISNVAIEARQRVEVADGVVLLVVESGPCTGAL